jgi:prepilin-type N-terminal cleavage/methylation domain-containing protein
MLRRHTAVKGGFTLIEVIMATAVLLVGFVGIIQVLTIGSESLDTARKQQIANQIIAAEIEKLRGGAWSTIANLPATATIKIGATGGISGDAIHFALSNRTVDPVDDNADLCALCRGFTCSFARVHLRPASASSATVTYLKLVYTITWTSNTGRAHTCSVGTYLGKNGLHLSYQQS